MLFKVAFSNIRRSIRDYAIYFFTLIIGVAVFYVFNAIGTQAAYLSFKDDSRDIVVLLTTMLSGVSVFVSVVLGLLIVYASRFLIKRRNKEFALYMLLGMTKRRISSILLCETVMIGLGSLAAGLLVGTGLSQVMSALVVNMFDADMSQYRFTISVPAIRKTIICFIIMYIIVMLFNTFMISKCKLIDLMQSGRRSEKLRIKSPWLCSVIFLISAAALGYAYHSVINNNLTQKKLMLMVAVGAFSTLFIFWSVSGLMLRVIMSVKKVYFKGLNSFTFRQISSKINTMVFSMSVICLMLFVTICTLASAFSVRNAMNINFRQLCSADAEYECAMVSESGDFEYADIYELYKENGYDITSGLSEYTRFKEYTDPDLTFRTFFGDQMDAVQKEFAGLLFDTKEQIYKLSDYNKLMDMYGREQLSLSSDQYAIVCDYRPMANLRNMILENNSELTVFGHVLTPSTDKCINGSIALTAQHINIGFIVVADEIVDENAAAVDTIIGNYPDSDKNGYEAAEKDTRDAFSAVQAKVEEKYGDNCIIALTTREELRQSSIGLGAILSFVGLYIGLVFLITCAAILALKELSESVDSIPRYEMLRKIGTEESEITRSLFRQTGIFFLLPLLLAILHSVFGMRFAVRILEAFGTEGVIKSVATTSIIILVIYGGYFLVTFLSSRSIIKEQK